MGFATENNAFVIGSFYHSPSFDGDLNVLNYHMESIENQLKNIKW